MAELKSIVLAASLPDQSKKPRHGPREPMELDTANALSLESSPSHFCEARFWFAAEESQLDSLGVGFWDLFACVECRPHVQLSAPTMQSRGVAQTDGVPALSTVFCISRWLSQILDVVATQSQIAHSPLQRHWDISTVVRSSFCCPTDPSTFPALAWPMFAGWELSIPASGQFSFTLSIPCRQCPVVASAQRAACFNLAPSSLLLHLVAGLHVLLHKVRPAFTSLERDFPSPVYFCAAQLLVLQGSPPVDELSATHVDSQSWSCHHGAIPSIKPFPVALKPYMCPCAVPVSATPASVAQSAVPVATTLSDQLPAANGPVTHASATQAAWSFRPRGTPGCGLYCPCPM